MIDFGVRNNGEFHLFVSRQYCDEKSVAIRNKRREERNAENSGGMSTGVRGSVFFLMGAHSVSIRFMKTETARKVRV